MTAVICKATAYGTGCGHPVGEHLGDQGNPCCCCNRTHNDPDHRDGCLDCHIRRIRADHPGATINADFAVLLPEALQGPFWDRAIQRYLDAQDAAEPETAR